MCVIAIKPKNKLIDWGILNQCSLKNPDGSGYAYASQNEVIIRKGFFSNSEMNDALELENINLFESQMMFHFRIATHGEISSSTCHPFPMSTNLEELSMKHMKSFAAIAHNGIVPDMNPESEISDTMLYIKDYLAPVGSKIEFPAVRKLIKHSAQSKLAILTSNDLYLIGDFIHDDNGWIFSNDRFKKLRYCA